MRQLWLSLLALILTATIVQADVWVTSYIRSDGTFVPGHWRTSPNNTRLDNYSTRGNVNPYTGRRGTVNPYIYQPRTYTPRQPAKPALAPLGPPVALEIPRIMGQQRRDQQLRRYQQQMQRR